MPLPSSGTITIGQIAAQFSSVASGYSLSSYNGVTWWLGGGPDDGTLNGTFGRPTSMSAFYNKQGNQPGPWMVWMAIGGGGGGGGGSNPSFPGTPRGGGAGGGTYPVAPAGTFKRWAFGTASVTVGAGGTGGTSASGGSNGSAGGSTSVTIAGSTYTAPGGNGNNGSAGGTTPPGAYSGGAAGPYGGGGGGSAVANGSAGGPGSSGYAGGPGAAGISSWSNFSSSFPGFTNFGGGGGGNSSVNGNNTPYQGGYSGTPSPIYDKGRGGWSGQDQYGYITYSSTQVTTDVIGAGGGADTTLGNHVGGTGGPGGVVISVASTAGGLNYDGNYFGFVYGSNTYYVLQSSGTVTTHFKPTGTVASTSAGMNGSNGYVGGKPSFTNTNGTTFTGSFVYQGANGSWSVILPRNTDTGSGFSGNQVVGVHPSSNWSTAELAELGITSPAYGSRYQLKYFGVNQDRGTVMSYGKMTRTAYLAAKAAGGGNVAISVFNNFQSGGNFDGNYQGGNALIPCVLWSHHQPGGRGYANWYYLNPDDRTLDQTWKTGADTLWPNFTSGYAWSCPGTRQGANGQPLLPILSGYAWTIGTDDIVFPVCDDQNAGGSSNMYIRCNVF